jgi:hypothetical protein
MEVSGQFLILGTIQPAKERPVAIMYAAGWAAKPVWMIWNKENVFSLPIIELPLKFWEYLY